MKALSIRSPWWWFILHAGKDIENRDWHTNFRGRVLVHASKWYVHKDVVEDIWTVERVIPSANRPQEHPYDWLKPFGGCIVGSVEIIDCVSSSNSPWFSGKYGFVLANPVAFDKPISCKGALGLFDVGVVSKTKPISNQNHKEGQL